MIQCADCRRFAYPVWWLKAAPALAWYFIKRHGAECRG